MKKITFLVPCYNSAAFMHVCVESLLKAGEEAEILLVNDGSTDDTGRIADDYARRYPNIIHAVHQTNGGHGAGINTGIALAQGVYFKVVDSDDWLDEVALKRFMQALSDEEPDLYLTNYVYTAGPERGDVPMHFRGFVPQGRTVGWEKTRPLMPKQFIMTHACTFKTELLRKAKIHVPQHTSYDDNVFVFGALLAVEKIQYLDLDLYRYLIGREGQSVQMEVALRKYKQQIEMAKTQFLMAKLSDLRSRERQKYRCLYHQTQYVMIIATELARIRARRQKDEQARRDWRDMWECCREHDEKTARKMMRTGLGWFCNVPGHYGEWQCEKVYDFANTVVRIN